MIKLYNVTKEFSTTNAQIIAVENVSLNIKKAEIYGIIGLSGAGKSTLIRCLNRLEEPSSGKITIDNIDITSLDKESLRKQRKEIGMIFQHFNLLAQKTVYENIAFPLYLENWKKKDVENRVDELLSFVELEDKKQSYPSELSGGQKQRVAIARAIANNPKVLLSDEGTSALDPQTTKSILNLLKKIRDEFGLTIVMITHQMEVVKQVCDKVAIMEKGKVIEENTVENLFKSPKTKIAKSFISSIHSSLDEEVLNPRDFKGKLIRLAFMGESSKKPIVSRLIKTFNIDVNILSGSIDTLQATNVGHLILEIIGEGREVEKVLDYLENENVNVEVI
ncbi:MAG: ATP-binding cassette domain-containing protein [Tissierellia bacterium]|nr:ATP-binding cassette domain-containing protein [Tissierellia bacterium]